MLESAASKWVLLFGSLALVVAGCVTQEAGPPAEEIVSTPDEVPANVRQAAASTLAALGPGLACTEWYWDREGGFWECRIAGLDYVAELDLDRRGGFSELEKVITFDEVRRAAPAAAEALEEACGGTVGLEIEVSVRDLELLTTDIRLDRLWGREGIFLEVQCPGGEDYEVDAFGSVVIQPDDDREPGTKPI